VPHPLVADTNHIYRGGFRILIDDLLFLLPEWLVEQRY
jgi:hypothetical protein